VKAVVIDTSAIMAILLLEPEADRFAEILVSADEVLVSAATLLEATLVAVRLTGTASTIERLVATQPLTVVPFDSVQLGFAQAGFARFGRGQHPARLNFGDCFSYALAKSRELPLLWKGDDFGQTDVVSALEAT